MGSTQPPGRSVVGGAGRMGRWMDRFLAAQGWQTAIVDPAAPAAEDRRGRNALPAADLVVVATTPRETARRYAAWAAEGPPAGLIVDIASIKTPLLDPIAGLRRVSKPGLRVYAKSTSLPRVLGGLGVAIISTSNGLLTDRQAAKRGVGGEVLAYVW